MPRGTKTLMQPFHVPVSIITKSLLLPLMISNITMYLGPNQIIRQYLEPALFFYYLDFIKASRANQSKIGIHGIREQKINAIIKCVFLYSRDANSSFCLQYKLILIILQTGLSLGSKTNGNCQLGKICGQYEKHSW